MMNWEIRVLMTVLFVVLAPFLGGLLDGIDRVITARMQGRKGPGILQPFYDLFKLMNKQLLAVNRIQILMLLSYLVFVIHTGMLFFGGFDLLLCFFSLSTAAMFVILASTSTHSPYNSIGSERELMQMMAYEPAVLLTAVGFYLSTGTFKVYEIFNISVPAIVKAPGFFIGFIFILTIKFRKSPFDISTSHHAHQEIVKGVTTEMAGLDYAMYNLAEWYENIFLYGVVGLFFACSNPWSMLWAFIAIVCVAFLMTLIDNVSARVRWELMLKLTWAITLLSAGVNLLILEFVR